MLFWTILKVALKSLLANKLRSFLAVLGIIIGVGAVIAMLAIGAGARRQILDRISSMGTNLLIVRPGQRGTGGVMSGTQQNLTLEDAQAIAAEIPEVKAVAPVVSGNAQAKYFNKNTRTSVLGTSITYFPARNFEIDKGRIFTEGEAERSARVAVIGSSTATDLFGEGNDPIGEIIKVKGLTFRVIGVMKSKGDQGWFNPDDQIIIPYTTAMRQLLGVDYLREINIHVSEKANLDDVQAKVTKLLKRRHRTPEGMPEDFSIRNQAEFIATATSVSRTFTILLGAVAGISLFVGGIGIMNIMLVTVTERTREIGIRKAIGAKRRDVLRQFLFESIVMSGLGGMLGVAAGIGAAKIIGKVTQFSTFIELWSILMALGFAVAVGVFFGWYPARRAAVLDPIEALRYE